MTNPEDLKSSAERSRVGDLEFDIHAVLEARSMMSHFQPIISIHEERVIGLEALIRATDPHNGKSISPDYLFDAANRHKESLQLDQMCREAALKGFVSLASLDPDLLLFINVDVSSLSQSNAESNTLIKLVEQHGIPTERVVIEIVESKIRDASTLQRFVTYHRKQDCLIALDDMGTGYSNLERIASIKPDIIKLDRSLIQDIDREYHKQELFDFFLKLAHKIGVFVVVEGIETEAEALSCLERGADLVQGFYFGYPQPPARTCLESGLDHASRLRSALTEQMVRRFTVRKLMYKRYNDIASQITAVVEMSNPAAYETMIEKALERFPPAECAYVIHESGRQLTRAVFNPMRSHRRRTALFGPSPAGGNQSAKEYFMYLGRNQRHYVTTPYVSVATGNVCVTISNRVSLSSGESYVVCVDINLSEEADS